MDQIWIRDLKLFAYHGVYEEEKRAGQDFLVSGRFFLNLQEAGITDELDCSVSYDELCVFISRIFTEKRRDLLEAVAEDLCRAVFKEYPKIMEIELSIYKPEAPVRAEVSKVGITVRRKRHRVFIGVGANEGESEKQIDAGLAALDEDPGCRLIRRSSMVRSTPYGGVAQADFCNLVAELETCYEPMQLLRRLKEIEAQQGVEHAKKQHWGPRKLDLDILFYDDLVLDSEKLVIPHPDMEARDFVLLPLKELAPYLRHPLNKKTVAEMADGLKEKHIIKE